MVLAFFESGLAPQLQVSPGTENFLSISDIPLTTCPLRCSLQNNATISSNSYTVQGLDRKSSILKDAIAQAATKQHVFVAAAGNFGQDNDSDKSPSFPAAFSTPNIISVAAVEKSNTSALQLASYSNFGATTVHVASPGTNILSTWPGNWLAYLSGTSMATPHVAGVVALLKAATQGQLTNMQLRDIVLSTVQPLASLKGKVSTAGVVDAGAAMALAMSMINQAASPPDVDPSPPDPPSPVPPPIPSPGPSPGPGTSPSPSPSPPPSSPAPTPIPGPSPSPSPTPSPSPSPTPSPPSSPSPSEPTFPPPALSPAPWDSWSDTEDGAFNVVVDLSGSSCIAFGRTAQSVYTSALRLLAVVRIRDVRTTCRNGPLFGKDPTVEVTFRVAVSEGLSRKTAAKNIYAAMQGSKLVQATQKALGSSYPVKSFYITST